MFPSDVIGRAPGIELIGGEKNLVSLGNSLAELDIFNVLIPAGKLSYGGSILALVRGYLENNTGAPQTAQLAIRFASYILPPLATIPTGMIVREEPLAEVTWNGGPALNSAFVAWWNYPNIYARANSNADTTLPQVLRLTIQFSVASPSLRFVRHSCALLFIPPFGGLTP